MILLRHGQSEFNLLFTQTRRDPGIKDPRLTPLGHQQAETAAEALAQEDVTRILVSPYTRALQTAEPLARRLNLPITVTPTIRERFAFTCDIGRPVAELTLDFPHLDLSHVDEIWWPPEEEPADQVLARAAMFRAEMAAMEDWQRTVVVSHWGFILSLTGQSVMNGQWIRCDPTTPAPREVIWRA